MKHKTVLVAPLLLAVALTMLVAPAAAQTPPVYALTSEGKGYARVCREYRDCYGWYVYGEASFDYCMPWGYAILDFGCPAAVYEIDFDTIRSWRCMTTFKAEWTQETMGCGPYVYSELCTGDIRVVVFVRNEESALVVVYGWGVKYIGCSSCFDIGYVQIANFE